MGKAGSAFTGASGHPAGEMGCFLFAHFCSGIIAATSSPILAYTSVRHDHCAMGSEIAESL